MPASVPYENYNCRKLINWIVQVYNTRSASYPQKLYEATRNAPGGAASDLLTRLPSNKPAFADPPLSPRVYNTQIKPSMIFKKYSIWKKKIIFFFQNNIDTDCI